ncbi:LADA_0E02256g1_1 [Lachancea dasiensis]|uniref:LADA_0E02256g1_1 n=1 Tax=Lachancea dasiensis TaxID=1072105 RepID=A0A1G4JAT4_9SACH|nr:LADA_0E02256g1_1 [Lachancea dasiensis]
MVYFYQTEADNGSCYSIILGKDKFENDALIKFGYKELNYVWFHADRYSSGHVYLKLLENEKDLRDVPREVVNVCLQLCKSKSIQGNKLPQCTIIGTPWTNLRKSGAMKPGEVSFKSTRRIQKFECHGRDSKLLGRLDKTRVELLRENMLAAAKKSKEYGFFNDYIAENRDALVKEEHERKAAKKAKKKVEPETDGS